MLKYLPLFILLFLAGNAIAQCDELFISEYAEGTDNNKALELFNPTSSNIDLSDYRLVRWVNGSTTADQSTNFWVQLTGTIAANSTYIAAVDRYDSTGTGGGLAGPEMDAAMHNAIVSAPAYGFYSAYNAPLGKNVLDFNGDDAISLEKWNGSQYVIVDIFGLIGERPADLGGNFGVGWSDVPPYWQSAGPYYTKDHTLIRKQAVLGGVTTNPGIPYNGDWDVSVEWDSLPNDTWADFGNHVCDCQQQSGCSELFFSEYVEGSGNDKALEIYNPTASPINLSGYEIKRYTNGALTPSGGTLALSGVIQAYDVWVVTNGQSVSQPNSPACSPALQALADQLDGPYPAPTYMNGNDAITLEYNGVIVDIIGKIGEDPGFGWADANGAVWTQNHTLVRKAAVSEGVTTNPGSFTVEMEWDSLPVNTWSELGQHQSACDQGGCMLSAFVTTNDASCQGSSTGSATALPSNGTGSLTYQWSASAGLQTTATATGLSAGTHTVTVTDALGCTASAGGIVAEPPAISLAFAPSNPTCGQSDGSLVAAGFGGNGGFSYVWNTGATGSNLSGLAAGTYTVTATDAQGCTVTGSETLADNGAPVISTTSSDATCFGACNGSAIVSTTGGSSPLSFAWSNGSSNQLQNNLCAGTYTITVTDAAGCVSSESLSISEPVQLSLSVSGTEAGCGQSNGTADALVSGGAGNYSYVWSNGAQTASISGLSAGSYTVTVTDANGCVASGFALVGNPNAPAVATSATNESCDGACDGSASVVAAGGTPSYNFVWSNGSLTNTATNLCSGTAFVTVTDAQNCSNVGSVEIASAGGNIQAGFTADTLVFLDQGGTVTFINTSTGAVSYSWQFGDGNGSAATSPTYSYSAVGTYTATLVASFSGCTDTATATITVQQSSSIHEVFAGQVQLQPNPAKGYTTLLVDPRVGPVEVTVMDALGAVVAITRLSGTGTLSLAELAPGAYWVRVTSREANTVKRLVVVE